MKRRRFSITIFVAFVLCVVASDAVLLWLLSHYHWFLAKDLLVLGQFVLQLLALAWSWARLDARKADAKRAERT